MNQPLRFWSEATCRVCTLLMLLWSPVFAVNKSWTGAVSTSWNEPGNWDPAGVPAAADEINFFLSGASATIVVDSGVAAVGKSFDAYLLSGATLQLTIQATASLTLDGNDNVAHGMAIRAFSGSSATIDVAGILVVREYDSRNVYLYNASNAGIVFNNTGTIEIIDCGTYGMHIDVTGSASAGAFNQFNNGGLLTLHDGDQYAVYLSGRSARPSTFVNSGVLRATDMDYLLWCNTEGPYTQTSTGSLEGEGIVRQVALITLAGTIRPGHTGPGAISLEDGGIQGFQLGSVQLEVEAVGTAGVGVSGGNDHLQVSGNSALTGMMVGVSFEGGFVPVNGDAFDFLNLSGAATGNPTFSLPSPPPGLAYNIVMVGGMYSLEVNAASFPVEFLGFSVEEMNNQAMLSWETASELNNEGFSVQRSMDGLVWEMLGFVEGAGNSQTVVEYEFADASPATGRNLYRLQQWDLDGQFSFSPTVELAFLPSVQAALRVYPVPMTSHVTVEGVEGHATLLSLEGKQVWTGQVGLAPQELAVEHLTPGVYFLQIDTPSQIRIYARLVKK